jgi:hypothetical protein
MQNEVSAIRPGMPLNVVHPEYGELSDRERSTLCRTKLEQYIRAGRARSTRVVEAILDEQPKDSYVPAPAIGFVALEQDLRLVVGGQPKSIHQHALDQAAQRANPKLRTYMHDLQGIGQTWANKLLATNLNELLQHQATKTRYLVREVDGKVRGLLSDSYRRIDSRPTLEAVIKATQNAKAAIVDGAYSETRVSLKVIRDEMIEVFPGEWMVFGLDFSNSDYGDGASEFSAFLLRLLCLNGAVTCKAFRKVHIGRRFTGDDEASERTLRFDAAAQASYAQDQVRALLSDTKTGQLVDLIRRANAEQIEPKAIEGYLKTRTNKAEAEAITDKFSSADIINLPPGQSRWRFSNAISWLATQTADDRRRMSLEGMAGEVMD